MSDAVESSGSAVPAVALRARPELGLVNEFGSGLEAARRAIGGLRPGCRLFGFTAGEFSLLDLLRAVLEVVGPAEVVLSTWTTGIRDAETAAWLLEEGAIRSLLLLTDRSFPKRQPAYCDRVLRLFGPQAMVCTNTHAKFATIKARDWRVVVRSSMNLNRNRRWEQFDLDDSEELFGFVEGMVARIVSTHEAGAVSARDVVDAAFDRAAGGVAGAKDAASGAQDAADAGPGHGLLSNHTWAL